MSNPITTSGGLLHFTLTQLNTITNDVLQTSTIHVK